MKRFFIAMLLPIACCAILLCVGATGMPAAEPIRFADIRQMDGRSITVQVSSVTQARAGMLRIFTTDGLTFEVDPVNVLLKSHL